MSDHDHDHEPGGDARPVAEPHATDGIALSPRLPASYGDGPAMVARPPQQYDEEIETSNRHDTFTPLRSDPPPALMSTWWLRVVLVGAMVAALVLTLWTEYTGVADDVLRSSAVAAAHAAAALCLLTWSALAIHNSALLVPPTRYQQRPRALLVVVLWLLAFAAPYGVTTAHDRLRERLAEPNDAAALIILVVVVFVGFVLLWLPFRFFARQAARIGAPHRAMLDWFWAPLISLVGVLGITSLGLRDTLADGGLTAIERTVGVAVVYGLAMFVFTLATLRAVTSFDEVVDLRWRRWKTEWDQTLLELASQATSERDAVRR